MKTLVISVVAIITVALTSCSKEPINTTETLNQFDAYWSAKKTNGFINWYNDATKNGRLVWDSGIFGTYDEGKHTIKVYWFEHDYYVEYSRINGEETWNARVFQIGKSDEPLFILNDAATLSFTMVVPEGEPGKEIDIDESLVEDGVEQIHEWLKEN